MTALNILANVTVPLAGLVDTAMLGHLPEIRFLAGAALAGVVFDYVVVGFGFLRMGTTGITAQAWGRDDAAEMHRILQRALLLALACGATILLLSRPIADFGFAILAGTPEVEAAGLEYFWARIWGTPAAMVNLAFLGWFLGREESRVALAITVFGNLTNIALNYVFIVRMGLAAQGAGMSTALSQFAMLAASLFFYSSRRAGAVWDFEEILDRGRLLKMLRLQRDIFLRTLCLVTSFALFTNWSAALGTVMLTVNTVLLRILSLAAYSIDGVAYATESLTGVFHGQGDREGLQRVLRLAMISGVAFGGIFALWLGFVPEPLLRLLTSHDEIVASAASLRGWLIATLLFGAVAYVWDGYFLGLGEGRTLRNAMLISLAAFVIPGAIGWVQASNAWLWGGLLAFMIARCVTLGWAARS